MLCWNLVLVCGLLAGFLRGSIADEVNINDELLVDETGIRSNNESSSETGPPDSHEAMNNRDIYPKSREKRSYEFLMGLINNNSRYEVTKVDPDKPKIPADEEVPAASELLLELMVKIAAHPDHWDKVHKLLQTIDRDLQNSKNIVDQLKSMREDPDLEKSKEEVPHHVTRKDKVENRLEVDSQETLKWPDFDGSSNSSNVQFVNSNNKTDETMTSAKDPWISPSKTSKSTYQKMFSYHRVTGKPVNTKKNPKAYIAVSIIAPKPVGTKSAEEDIELENELHQLRPWTHKQNLKNMASIRSRWLVQSEEESNDSKTS